MMAAGDFAGDPQYLASDARLARAARACLSTAIAGFLTMLTLLILTMRPHHAELWNPTARTTLPAIAIGAVGSVAK